MPNFDGVNLVITLDSGVTEVDAEIDLYSDWKEWLKTGGNSKYPLAFRTIGGDALTPGIDAGAYFFIRNDLGWRIRPAEEDATVLLTGNLAPQDSTLPILIPTIGTYRVLVAGLQPITQNIDTIKDTLEHSTFNNGVYIDAVNGKPGTIGLAGNEKNPVDTYTDAEIIAVKKGFTKLYIRGPYTFGEFDNIDNYTVIGEGTLSTMVTVVSGCSTVNTGFKELGLEGDLSGIVRIDHGHLGVLTGLYGDIHESELHGNISLDNSGPTSFMWCVSGIPGVLHPIVNAGGITPGINVRGYIGGFGLEGLTGGNVSLDFISGHGKLYSGCTGGICVMRGTAKSTNEANGTFLDISNLVNPFSVGDPIIKLVESQRGHHTATGDIFYWDPINGSDANDGLTESTAKLTWLGANALVVANHHDLVILMPGEVGGVTIITEQIVLDKEYTFIRGPGRDVLFRPTNTTGETISIEAVGCEISGMRVETASTGDGEAIVTSADFSYIHDVWVEYSRGGGIRIQNVKYVKVKDILVHDCIGNGVVFRGVSQDCKYNMLADAQILGNGGHGILFTGALCMDNYVWGGEDGITIVRNTGWGINESDNANYNHVVGPTIHVDDNISGDVNLIGTESKAENIQQWSTHAAGDILDRLIADHQIDGSLAAFIRDLHDEAFGKWDLDEVAHTLTLYKADGLTVLKIFDLNPAAGAVPAYTGRTP